MSGEPADKKQRMDLSPRTQSIVAALNASLGAQITAVGGKVDVVQGSMVALSSRVGNIEGSVADVKTTMTEQGDRITSLEKEMAALRTHGAAPSPSPDSPTQPTTTITTFPPKGQRRTVVFCFWPADTPREDIVADLKTFVSDHDLVDPDGFFAPARFCNKGKIRFRTVAKMWHWIKSNKGSKFKGDQIWWAIDKPMAERLASKKVTAAVRLVKEYLVSKEGVLGEEVLRSRVPADYDNSIVLCKPTPEARAVRVLELPRGESLWVRVQDSPELIGFDWVAALAAINNVE